jgi:hypothetical protein
MQRAFRKDLVKTCLVVTMVSLWTSLVSLGVVHAQSCGQTELNQEFLQDPTARNYVSCASDGNLTGANVSDQCVLDFFNAPCTNHASCKVANILTREQIYATIIDANELDTLANGTAQADVKHQRELGWLLSSLNWNMSLNASQKHWKNPFPAATAPITNAAIDAAKQKDSPRSQIVCGRIGTLSDISCGLRGTGC